MNQAATVKSAIPWLALPNLAEGLNGWLSRRGGLLVTLGVVTILGLLIVPVSPVVMDVLIGVNIALAATILLVSLYISDATRIPSFPTILLLTTLYRLALNVSSTRLVLTEAHAGKIIEAFGQFVVQGNYVVGAVIFLILTLIQFIVITKGAERVAEVSARFTLDAMGGKQMSIDADLRAQLISPEEARGRRRALDNESKLYGAMDGAMKFVKGDAIAGIVISAINIIGGLVIGVFQQGMSPGEAAQVYALLTIGDGLVSQIPALLISTAAGLVVTRVATNIEGDSGHAGKDIVDQILNQPSALAFVSGLLILMGIVPTGLPRPVFFILGVILGVISIPRLPVVRAYFKLYAPAEQDDRKPSTQGKTDAAPVASPIVDPTPVALELGSALTAVFIPKGENERSEGVERLRLIIRQLVSDMGMLYPEIQLRPTVELAADEYRLSLFDCPVMNGRMSPDDILLACHEREASRLGLAARGCRDPITRTQSCLLPKGDFQTAQEAGLRPRGAAQVILQHVQKALRQNSASFLGIQETQWLLDTAEKKHPDLVEAVVPRGLTLAQLTAVLQRLVAEEVPIRDFRMVLEKLAQWVPAQKHPLDLAEAVRRSLRRTLWHRYASRPNTLSYYLLDSDLEQLIESGRSLDMEVPRVHLPAEARQATLQAMTTAFTSLPASVRTLVLVTRSDLRPFVRALFESDFPEVVVLSHEEVVADPGKKMEWLGDIRLVVGELKS